MSGRANVHASFPEGYGVADQEYVFVQQIVLCRSLESIVALPDYSSKSKSM